MGVNAAGSSRTRLVPDDRLSWHTTLIGGRAAVYGVGGGDGPPVVFLHGWALGSHAYKRAIRRLTNRGCRVFAPALPSFGGTADLPRARMNIAGYADWVASFMVDVGIEEPALVIGHSFGGAIAIKLARDNPLLVRYLILLNAAGGGGGRWPWEWVTGFGREIWPVSEALEMLQAMRSDLAPNLVRNPVGMVRAGLVALGADLRSEMAELKKLGVPVLALTSDRDKVIPRDAFETVCDTLGAESRVVSGGHAWMLVDPDSFGEVLASTIDVQVAEHEASRTADRRSEIERLLEPSHLTRRAIRSLVASAAPLWLLSESASTLAGDLLLCRPPLKKNEVRAVARHIEDSTSVRLTIVARDRPGLLADSAAVLATAGLPISSASASTWAGPKLALHSFVVGVDGELPDTTWEALGERLQSMVANGQAPRPALGPLRPVTVTVQGVGDRSMVKVVAPDETGLLSTVCRYFQLHDVNIETLRARTENGIAHDTFLVVGRIDPTHLKDRLEHRPLASEASARIVSIGQARRAV